MTCRSTCCNNPLVRCTFQETFCFLKSEICRRNSCSTCFWEKIICIRKFRLPSILGVFKEIYKQGKIKYSRNSTATELRNMACQIYIWLWLWSIHLLTSWKLLNFEECQLNQIINDSLNYNYAGKLNISALWPPHREHCGMWTWKCSLREPQIIYWFVYFSILRFYLENKIGK